jgi:hypothetical protein
MASDFGLLVGRYSSGEPTIASDQELRELRIDVNGRAHVRLNDGNDNTLSYFADGDAVNSGVGNASEAAGDRGLLILGKDDLNSTYQVLKVKDDGSLVVSLDGGLDVSEAAKSNGVDDGEVTLTVGTWVKVQEIAVASGRININGFSYASDKNTVFQLVLSDDTAINGHDRADLTEIIDTHITTSARPSDHVSYNKEINKNGGTNISLVLWAKQLQAGTAGVAFSSINANTVS